MTENQVRQAEGGALPETKRRYEDRFYDWAESQAEKIGLTEPTSEQIDYLAGWCYAYFCADMSDDYSKTLREQAALNAGLERKRAEWGLT